MKPRIGMTRTEFAAEQSARCEACDGAGILPNTERCDLCGRFDSDESARIYTAAWRAYQFLAANFSDADMPDILPQLRAALLPLVRE